MAVEIEKKFLVQGDSWKEGAPSEIYFQSYLASGSGVTVRVRIAGKKGFLTIKGKRSGISRLEFEYPLPMADARLMIEELCLKPVIHKRRYRKEHDGDLWEIDEFFGENKGLVLAEIELSGEHQEFTKPPWLGEEVSQDNRYYNASLRTNPFSKWAPEQSND